MSGGVSARLTMAVAIGLGLALPMPAAAQAPCWSEADVDAAKIRDLQSRLMVATLRCQAAGVDVTRAYNRFIIANRATLQGINGVLMTQFRSGSGDEAQGDYDRFATALANNYGGETTNRRVCDDTSRLADEAAAARGSVHRLVALHARAGLPSPLPHAACERVALRPLARPEPIARPVEPERRLGWLVLE